MIKAEWTNADTLDLQPTCNQLATDCISRQAAIDALCKRCDLVSDDEPCTEECNDIKILEMLPSAESAELKAIREQALSCAAELLKLVAMIKKGEKNDQRRSHSQTQTIFR